MLFFQRAPCCFFRRPNSFASSLLCKIVLGSAVLFAGLSHIVTAVEADDRDADYAYEMMEDDE